MVGVFAACGEDGTPHIAVTGARTDGAFRWEEAEMALTASFVAEKLRGVRLSQENLAEDLFANAAYRAHLTEVFARKAVTLANGPAPGVMVLSHGSQAGILLA
jgi:carbon-monoxide dehydrogenase medium subunit